MKNKLLLSLTLFFLVIPTSSSCASKTHAHYFNFYGDNCTIDNKSEFHSKIYSGNKNITFQLVANKNYILPKEIKTESTDVTYDSNRGIIKINEVKGDVTVSASAEHGYSHFSFAGVNCTINNKPIYDEDFLTGTKDIVYYIKQDDGYVLPEKIDGIDGTGATYNKEDGSIYIPEILSNITLAAVSKYKYQFTFFGTNCMIGGEHEYVSDIIEGAKEVVFNIKPDSKYVYPLSQDVKISGVGKKNVSYDEVNGLIKISEVTGSIRVDAETLQTEDIIITFNPDNGEESFYRWTKFKTPIEKPSPAPTKKDKFMSYIFDGWYKILEEGVEVPFEFEDEDNYYGSEINLIAKWKEGERNKYLINANDVSTLAFTDLDGDDKLIDLIVTAGKAFYFKMKVINPSIGNSIDYVVPSVLDIYVDGSGVPLKIMDEYSIVPNVDETEAIVMIRGNSIDGDIVVSSNGAVLDGTYNYEAESFGIKSIESGVCDLKKPLQIKFEPDGNYDLPKAENIYVYFDGIDQYISPEEGFSSCTYDDKTGTLTIYCFNTPTWIKNSIKIYVRASDYDLLSERSWENISSYSKHGYAKYMFYIGEKKTISLYGHAHTVMIIDFDHDRLTDGSGNAGITFEFVNVITDDGDAKTKQWNNKDSVASNNGDFPNSTLNDFCSSIYSDLSKNIKKYVCEVEKKVAKLVQQQYKIKTYKAKFFPLAYSEMSKNDKAMSEGEIYTYWNQHDSKEYRIKNIVGSSDKERYWLRSPNPKYAYCAWYCTNKGELRGTNDDQADVFRYEHAVAPAFCI